MPHRSQLRDLLDRYNPEDKSEIAAKKRMIELLSARADCFERSALPAHFTGSSWLESRDGANALLMHHAKIDKWVQPGGHADGNGDLLAVAIREAQEESGITHIEPVSSEIFDIDIHIFPAKSGEPEHLHYDVRFLLQVTSDEVEVQNAEAKELRWVGKNLSELPTSDRSIVRLFEKWISTSSPDKSVDTVLDF